MLKQFLNLSLENPGINDFKLQNRGIGSSGEVLNRHQFDSVLFRGYQVIRPGLLQGMAES